jgi:SAM-dependent methyltransferase
MVSAWDALATHYQASVQIDDSVVHYGPNGPSEADLHLIGDVRGKSVLELGCGGGQNAIALARRGALVTAVDLSKTQLAFAAAAAFRAKVRVRFVRDDVASLGRLPRRRFDLVVSSFALEYVADLAGCLRVVAARLRRGGRVVLCDLHPFASSADLVGVTRTSFAASADYFRPRRVDFAWPLSGRLFPLFRHHRTFADYFAAFRSAGLAIRELREPKSGGGTAHGPYAYFDRSIARQQALWNRIPYTLIFVLEKDSRGRRGR